MKHPEAMSGHTEGSHLYNSPLEGGGYNDLGQTLHFRPWPGLERHHQGSISITRFWAISSAIDSAVSRDLTGFFWTKRIVRNSLGKEECHAEEEVQCGADRDAAASD